MIYVSTFVMSLWIFANILQDLHDVHDRFQNLTKTIAHYNSTTRIDQNKIQRSHITPIGIFLVFIPEQTPVEQLCMI